MQQQKILVTAALPYANGAIHFGHLAGAYLPADCYARFQRFKGNKVLFICGSDEYGIPISLSAELAHRTPQEHVNIFHAINKDLFQKFQISFDHYSRTTWPGHVEPVYAYFNDLLKNGYIDERETEQLYSEQDQKFLADRYVVGICPKCGFPEARGDECTKCGSSFDAQDLKKPRSKLSGAPLSLKKTRHWFLRLDLFKDRLLQWLEKKNWKPNVTNFIKSYIQDLKPRAITRDTPWGIPVPLENAKGKVLYVWFDAPIGYISATREWAQLNGTPDAWKEYWLDPETRLVQFIGKDNITFHAVIFPAMTMGQNTPYKLVDELPANEFYNLEGKQFSKSEGWYIDSADFLSKYPSDSIRYAIASNAPETQDSEFTWKDFQTRVNSELIGKFGNFIHRTLVFIENTCQFELPRRGRLQEDDEKFIRSLHERISEVAESLQTFHLRRACALIMEMAQAGNVYFDQKKPWLSAKNPELHEPMETALFCCLECCKLLAVASYPIMPATAEAIWGMLGFEKKLSELTWSDAISYATTLMHLKKPEPLFRKIEDEEIEKEMTKFASTQPAEPLVSFDEVKKVQLKVVEIINAEPIPKSKKLLRLTCYDGVKNRTVVAGIAQQHTPADLMGKHVVIVANLQPATLMGVTSEGMLLVAGPAATLLELPAAPAGTLLS